LDAAAAADLAAERDALAARAAPRDIALPPPIRDRERERPLERPIEYALRVLPIIYIVKIFL
jgi:hypothetical protein